MGPQRQGVAPWPGRWRGVASRAQPVCPLTELWRSAWQRRAKAPDGFDSILRGGGLSPANLENRIKSIGSRCKWPHVTEAGRMRRTPFGGCSKRRAAKRFARSADEGQSPKLKSRHARSRSNGAELPAAEIDAPRWGITSGLGGSRRTAEDEERQPNAVCLEPGKPGYNGSHWLK